MQSTHIGLTSLSSSSVAAEVAALISDIGHIVRSHPAPSFLSGVTDDHRQPMVLVIGAGVPEEKIGSAMRKWRGAILGIFEGGAETLPHGLLHACSDFICWPCTRDELALRIRRLSEREGASYESSLDMDLAALNMVGHSPAFHFAIKTIKRVARCDAPVLIEGETGTGKELAARAIHYFGSRRDHAFIPVNCGALPDTLIENELFGHEKGAYTDAREAAEGLVAQADGGTLFLDEIDTLSTKGQIALLRFLQDYQYRSVGGRRLRTANVRLITASNASLTKAVTAKQFREDLLFRINVLSVALPPLRARGDDVIELARHFIAGYCRDHNLPGKTLHPDSVGWLLARPWQGNVRELQNLVLREVLLSDEAVIALHDTPSDNERRQNGLDRRLVQFAENFSAGKNRVIAHYERSFVEWVLRECHGNVSAAARRAGKERRAFGKLLKKYGLDSGLYRVADDPQGG